MFTVSEIAARKNEAQRRYASSKKGLLVNQRAVKKYRATEKGKLVHRKSVDKFQATEEGKRYKLRASSKYHASEKGKEAMSRARNKRKRDLGFTKLSKNPYPDDVEVDWHHVDDEHVVAVPRYVHNSVGGNRETHRKKMKPIAEAVYYHPEELVWLGLRGSAKSA